MKISTDKIVHGLAIVLGAVFIMAGTGKLSNLGEFRSFIEKIPNLRDFSLLTASFIIALEFAIGCSLVLSSSKRDAARLAIIILIGFTAFQLLAPLILEHSDSCPCFRIPLLEAMEKSLAFRVGRNIVMLLIGAAVLFLESKPQPDTIGEAA